ncbi:hypothetical protein H0H87_001336 [Tephrocybe sp. NHM501043]|nr:hypothetical protein H0H87_001336 [Tephrocybe sp. NHM501043]
MSTQIFGWAPITQDQVDVSSPTISTSHPQALKITIFEDCSSTSAHSTRESSPETSSPAASDSSLTSLADNARTSVQRPGFVPRPRNPFIIFRCEYSQLHTKKGKRVRRPPGTSTEKTLSKRAAEAWHLLSAPEKYRYRVLADLEKEEHTRAHPNYRFRPKKRALVQKHKSAALSKSNPASPLSVKPPVLAPAPQYTPSSPYATAPPSPLSPQPLADMVAVKAGRRRSASVPSLFFGGNPSFPVTWTRQSPRLEMKRSRSAMADRPPLFSSSHIIAPLDGSQSFKPQENTSSGYDAPDETFGTVLNAHHNAFSFPSQYSTSNLPSATPSSSSLASWNGEVQASESASSWSSSPLLELSILQSTQALYSDYSASSSDASLAEVMARYSHDQLASASSVYSDVALGLESSGALFSPVTLYNDATSSSYIMAEYTQLVDSQQDAVEHYQEAMLALNINESRDIPRFDFNDYLQPTFTSHCDVHQPTAS